MKIPRLFLSYALVLAATLGNVASLRADSFDDANRAFAQGHFAESARGYENLLRRDGYSPAVLFNLGNANLRAGQAGEAILDYERARWLAPRDADIAANLRFARQRAGLAATTEDEPWYESAASLLAPNTWAWLASAALVVLCLGIIGGQMQAARRGTFRLLTAASALVLCGSLASIAVDAGQLNRAVLPAKNTAALLSPFAGAKTVFEFPAGQAVRVEKTHGSFCYVRDEGGHAGWVDNAQIGRIAGKPS